MMAIWKSKKSRNAEDSSFVLDSDFADVAVSDELLLSEEVDPVKLGLIQKPYVVSDLEDMRELTNELSKQESKHLSTGSSEHRQFRDMLAQIKGNCDLALANPGWNLTPYLIVLRDVDNNAIAGVSSGVILPNANEAETGWRYTLPDYRGMNLAKLLRVAEIKLLLKNNIGYLTTKAATDAGKRFIETSGVYDCVGDVKDGSITMLKYSLDLDKCRKQTKELVDNVLEGTDLAESIEDKKRDVA